MCYKCSNCGNIFDEPREVHTSYEAYYGVSSDFPNSTPMTYYCCPCCGDEDFEELDEEEEEE